MKCFVRDKSSAQKKKKFKVKPNAKYYKRVSNLRASSPPAKLPACEKELKNSLSSEENHNQQRTDANVIERRVHVPIL